MEIITQYITSYIQRFTEGGVINIIGQCVGLVSMILGFFIPQQKKRLNMLYVKIVTDVLWITHFGMIGAISAMAISCVAFSRSLTFIILERSGKKRRNFWLYVFLTAGAVSVFLVWLLQENMDPVCILSLIVSILGTLSYWQKNTNVAKVMLTVVSISSLIYALIKNSVPSFINECITLTSMVIYLFRYIAEKRREKRAAADESETEQQ